MKRIAALVITLLFLVGCSSNPPKIGVIIDKDTPIELNEKSSDALKILKSFNEVGVRDLTMEEFEQHQGDIEKFNALIGEQKKFNRLAYEAGGIGLGLAAGLSSGVVFGYAAVTTIFSNDAPDNYDFAWDYNTNVKVYNKKGIYNNDVKKAFILAVKAMSIELELSTTDSVKINETINLEHDRSKYTPSIQIWSKDESNGKSEATLTLFCNEGDISCDFASVVRLSGKNTVMGVILASKAAELLPEDYFFYFPPNKPYNRLPMLVRGGTGEIEYLVEKG